MAGRARDRAGTRRAGSWALAAAALVLVMVVGAARADDVDVLLGDLRDGRDYKVRLAAALSLGKRGDPRAIPAFIAALDDKDRTVRGAAVIGLGKLIDATTSEMTRRRAIDALDKIAKGDPGDAATKQAIKVRDAIAKLASAAPIIKGGTYFDLAPMSAKAKGDEALRDLMRATVQKGLTKLDPKLMLTWPTGKVPTAKDLERNQVRGYHVDGNILEVSVVEKGSASLVSCRISMLIATYPGKSIFGFLEGGAKVQGSNTAKDIALAKQDCVTAVVEDLVAKKIMPTIRTKAGPNL
jgi:hypothetical protein